MGGAYIKVERPGKKSRNPSYRIGRYGPFDSGKVTGHFWDPLKIDSPEEGGDHGELSAFDLVDQGAKAEQAMEDTSAFEKEAQERIRKKLEKE